MYIVAMTGVQFPLPFGAVSDAKGDTLGARYGWQWVPLELGLGSKIIDELYVGGYFSVSAGFEGHDQRVAARCEAGTDDVIDDVSCSSATVHAGIEVRYSFAPAERINGWVGYGFGYTGASQTISDDGRYSETSAVSGLDLARLTGGLDFRFTRGFGLEPYVAISMGRYSHRSTTINLSLIHI